jgi:hypothetical protein
MKKWVTITLHFVVWTLLLLSNVRDFYEIHSEYFDKSIIASGLSKGWYAFLFNLAYMMDFLVAFYGTYLYVGPFLFLKKKYLRAVINLFLVLAVMVVTRYAIEFHFLIPYLKYDNYFGNPFQPTYYIENCIGYTYRYCLFGLLVYFLVTSNRLEKEKRETEKEKIQAELSFLKSQINPHFLFNTINDIYALAYKKDDKTPYALLKLASMLRYMLKEGALESVLVKSELSYLRDYIELQEIGSKGKLYLQFTVIGDTTNQYIAPLLLIPFVENIFKHGIVNDPDYPATFKIEIEQSLLKLHCRNQIKQKEKDYTSGIGLSNVQRRLELLYPNKHSFKVNNHANTFSCFLQMQLNA